MSLRPLMTADEVGRYVGTIRRQVAGIERALGCDRDSAARIVVDAWIQLGPQENDDGSMPVPDAAGAAMQAARDGPEGREGTLEIMSKALTRGQKGGA